MKFSRIYHFTSSDGQINRVASPADAIPNNTNDDAHEILFDKLRSVFLTHPRRQFGFFETSPEAEVAILLKNYQLQQIDNAQLAEQLASQFQSGLPQEQDINVYLWLVIDHSGDSDVLYVFLLQHDESFHISPQLTVRSGPSLFTNRLQYGARVHLNEWLNDNVQTYLSMVAPRNQHPQTLAWNTFIRFHEGLDRAAKTEEFLGSVEQFTQTLEPEKAQEYRSKVVDYCLDQDKQGMPVELRALSEHVDDAAPNALLNFLKERIEEPPQGIYTDRKQLRRYTRFFGRDQDLSIGFSTAMLGNHISYDEHSDTLTIRAIPKALKSQLRQYLKKPE